MYVCSFDISISSSFRYCYSRVIECHDVLRISHCGILSYEKKAFIHEKREIILVLNIIVTKELLSLNVITVGGPLQVVEHGAFTHTLRSEHLLDQRDCISQIL